MYILGGFCRKVLYNVQQPGSPISREIYFNIKLAHFISTSLADLLYTVMISPAIGDPGTLYRKGHPEAENDWAKVIFFSLAKRDSPATVMGIIQGQQCWLPIYCSTLYIQYLSHCTYSIHMYIIFNIFIILKYFNFTYEF